MKLTVQLKLQPTPEQSACLLETMERFNEACNFASEVAKKEKAFSQARLHRHTYTDIRATYGLSAQMAVRAIGKVVEAYKPDKKKPHSFRPLGAMVYDERILTYKGESSVSILTLEGRQMVPFVCGDHQKAYLPNINGQADLVYRDGMFFLLQTADAQEAEMKKASDFLGVDLGIKNIAVDSDGEAFSGGLVNGLRTRHAQLRARLQQKGTTSAKRLLKKRRRKEKRFTRNVNHVISKKLVAKAQGTSVGIALEDLKGIRERITVRKSQRRIQHSWGFSQLRLFVEYKAQRVGIPVVSVDPRNTSRTCPNPECRCVDKKNRKSQAVFTCVQCGFSGHADHIAAENIRRAAVSQPDVDATS